MKKKFVTRKKEEEAKKEEAGVEPSNEVAPEEKKAREAVVRGKYTSGEASGEPVAPESVPLERYLKELRARACGGLVSLCAGEERPGPGCFGPIVSSLGDAGRPANTKTAIRSLEEVLDMRKLTLSDILKNHKTPIREIR